MFDLNPLSLFTDSTIKLFTSDQLPCNQSNIIDSAASQQISDEGFMAGLNVHTGHLCCEAVAKAHGLVYSDPEQFLI